MLRKKLRVISLARLNLGFGSWSHQLLHQQTSCPLLCIFVVPYRFMEVELKLLFIEPPIIENNGSTSYTPQLTLTVCPLVVPAEWRDVMWRSTGRRCGWETSSGCVVTRSSPPTSCCWAPVTPTACATSRPPHWTERPTSSRGRSSAASLTWWDGRFLLFISIFS